MVSFSIYTIISWKCQIFLTSGNGISPLPLLDSSIRCLTLPGWRGSWDHALRETCDGFQERLIEL